MKYIITISLLLAFLFSSDTHPCQHTRAELVEYFPLSPRECLYTYAWKDGDYTYSNREVLPCTLYVTKDMNVHFIPKYSFIKGYYYRSYPEKYIVYQYHE